MTNARGPVLDAPAFVVALAGPLLAAVAVVAASAAWADELPARLVSHWGPSGPDAYDDRSTLTTVMAVVAALVPAAAGLPAGFARVWTPLRRSLLGFGTGLAVILGGLGVITLAVQRGGAAGSPIGWPLVVVLAGGILTGVLARRVPRDRRPVVLATRPPDPALPRGAAVTVPEHPIGGGAHLRVTADAVVVRRYRWEPVRVPIAEVTAARARTVSPLGEFGGWGLRMAPGGRRYGFLSRAGAAVELAKADGTTWVITTPRAEEVAGAVNAAADRRLAR